MAIRLISLPTTGTNPKTTTKGNLDAEVNASLTQVYTDIAANTAATTAALALKASTAALTSGLATKADVVATTAAIARKLNTSAFTGSAVESLLDAELGGTEWKRQLTNAEIKAGLLANADTNNFSDAYRTKVDGLDDPLFLGLFVSLAALQSAHASPVVGAYAYVDADPVETWSWNGSAYVQGVSGGGETPASVKSKLLSNPDTENFGTADKARLDNLPTSAFTDRAAFDAATIAAPVVMASWLSGQDILTVRRDVVGTIAQGDGTLWSPVGDVTPDHWSSTTGTNATPGAQAAIDYLESIGGGTLRLLPKRIYNFTASVTVSGSYITIDATGAKITAEGALGPEVDGSNRPNGVFEFIGVEAAQTTLSADASEGAQTITVTSATGIEAGQVIRLFNTQSGTGYRWYTDGANTVYRHFITRVTAVLGSIITLADPLPMDFDATTFTCVVRTWDGLHGCHVIGGDWDAGGYERDTGNGEGNALVYAEYCQDLSIRPETVRGFNGAAVWIVYTAGFKFTCGYMEGHRDAYADPIVETLNSGFYGVRMDDCKGCVVGGFTANRLRHVIDGSRTWDAVISDIVATNSHRTPFGTHNGCSNWLHKNLSSRGPNGGFLWRGFDCSVDGLFIDAPNDSESAFYDTVGAVGDLKRTYHLSNFQTNMGRASIQLNADIDTCIINGGVHKGAGESAAYNVIQVNTLRLNTFQMNGGVVQGAASRLVDFATGATERRTVSFTGTEFRDYTTSAVRCEAVTGATSLRVTGGYFAQSGGATKVHVDAIGTFQNLQRNGFVAGANFTYQPDNEGDWTPTLGNRTINCTLAAETSAQWRRDGDRVTVSGEIRLSSVNGATGAMYLGGLPFSVFRDGGGLITWASGFDAAASTDIRLRATTGDSDMLLVQGSTGTDVSISAVAFEDTTRFFFTATYTTDD